MQTVPVDSFDIPLLGKIYQITLPTPFPVGPVHTYLVEGEPLTLIDTGPYTPDAWEALVAGLGELGYTVLDLERIIITHAHSDHFGLVGKLAEISHAAVWAYAMAQPWIEGSADFHDQRQGFWGDLLAASDVPGPLAEPTARLYRSFRHLQTCTTMSGFLAHGSRFTMAGAEWETLYCPGHSSSLVCFYQPQSRLLIGNDHLLAHISSNAIVEPPPPGAAQRRKPLIDYWRSLRQVYDLDVALALPGHGAVVADPRGLIDQRFQFYERRLSRLREQLALGPRTVWQLAEALFRRLDAVDVFLAASEVVGHLDVLEENGEVTRRTDAAGVWRYELTR
jgi:glyoxylase-like metal-dependent hydrolase (beta-lactamase superfamily II)